MASSHNRRRLPAEIVAAFIGGFFTIVGALIGIGVIPFPPFTPPTATVPPAPEEEPTPTPTPTYLAELTPTSARVGFGSFSVGEYEFTSTSTGDDVQAGDPIKAHGITYAHGIYAHAPSRITYSLKGRYSTLETALVMIERISCGDGVIFKIVLDDVELYQSPRQFATSGPVTIQVSVRDGDELELITEAGINDDCDWAIWGNPVLQ